MVRPASGQHGPSLSTFQALSIASQFGVSLAVAVALGLFVGQWLDGLLRTVFVFTLIGVFVGLATAITGTVTLYRAVLRKTEREWREQRSASLREPAPDDQIER
jgi:hypothetical protein